MYRMVMHILKKSIKPLLDHLKLIQNTWTFVPSSVVVKLKYASLKAATESPDHPIDTSLYFGAGLAYFDPSFTFKPDKNLKYLFDFAPSQAIKSVPFNERGTSVANSTLFDDSGYNSTKQLSSGGVFKVCFMVQYLP